MANQKISALTALTGANVASDDALAIVDTSATTTKKIDASELKTFMSASPTLVTPTANSLTMSGDISSVAWTTSGIRYKGVAATFTDTTSTGTVAAAYTNVYGGNTIAASNATTFTDYYTTFINGPTAGTNVTFSRSWALGLSGSLQIASASELVFSTDLRLGRNAAASLRLGAADAAAPVPQTLGVQSVVAGTSNTAGVNFTIKGSAGTGTGAGGSIIFRVAPAGSTGTAQNTFADALTISSDQNFTVHANFPTIFAPNGPLQFSVNGNQAFTIRATTDRGVAVRSNGYYGFSQSGNPNDTTDVFLYRDAANTLALRNGTSAQLLRVYSTYNGTNDAYGAIGAAINLDGSAGDANTLYIGSQKKGSPTALTKLAIQVNGTTQADFNITASSAFAFKSNVRLDAGLQLYFTNVNSNNNIGSINGTFFTFQSASAVTLGDWGLTGNVVFQFGGTTSSFPALKRSSATLQARLADDSAFAPIQGKLTTDTAYAAGDPATTGYLVVYDSTGTAYKIPALAV